LPASSGDKKDRLRALETAFATIFQERLMRARIIGEDAGPYACRFIDENC
jgi:hypothetical protein